MDKAKIVENVKNLNTLTTMTIDMVNTYIDDACKNADKKELLSVMGAQATALFNMAVLITKNTELTGLDEVKFDMLKDKMSNLIEGTAQELGIDRKKLEIDDDIDDTIDIEDEDVDSFAKTYKLTKSETAVLKKIVRGKGAPTDMTEKDNEIALKMAGKIAKIDGEL